MSRNPNPYIKVPSSINFVQNYRVPYRMCPQCGSGILRINNNTHLTCTLGHILHECPTCLDTRISDRRENITYCGLLHPYHLCAIHKIPVVGMVQWQDHRCTCSQNPKSIIRQKEITQWQSAFL